MKELDLSGPGVPVHAEQESGPDLVPLAVAKRITDLIAADSGDISTVHDPSLTNVPRTILERVRAILDEAYVPADIQRAALRAGRFKAFMETLEKGLSGDVNSMKAAAEWSKQIGADPEVGLNQAPQVAVNIEIGELKDVLTRLEPIEGFAPPEFLDEETETND